jgi:hypothetical protein
LESQTTKRKEKVNYSNLLEQLRSPCILSYYIVTQGETQSLVTTEELEHMKTRIRTRSLSP